MSEEKFDAMFWRIKVEGIPYGSGPTNLKTIIAVAKGRRDPDGHILELLTVE